MPVDYHSPCFTLRQAAEASDFAYNSVRAYYQRGWFRSFAQELGKGRGKAGLLCLGDVLVLTIASRLSELGAPPIDAFNEAMLFAIMSKYPKDGPKRKVLDLFPRDTHLTVLIWAPRKKAKIIAIPRSNPSVPIAELQCSATDGTSSVVIILNDLEAAVFRHLGIDGELAETDK